MWFFRDVHNLALCSSTHFCTIKTFKHAEIIANYSRVFQPNCFVWFFYIFILFQVHVLSFSKSFITFFSFMLFHAFKIWSLISISYRHRKLKNTVTDSDSLLRRGAMISQEWGFHTLSSFPHFYYFSVRCLLLKMQFSTIV